MVSKTYKEIVAKSVIMSRDAGLTSSGQRRLIEKAGNGRQEPVDMPIKIFMSAQDCKTLAESGYSGVFKTGDNFVTMSEIVLVVNKVRPKIEKLTDAKKKGRLGKIVNRLMSVFGPVFVNDIGGYINIGNTPAKIVARSKVIMAKK